MEDKIIKFSDEISSNIEKYLPETGSKPQAFTLYALNEMSLKANLGEFHECGYTIRDRQDNNLGQISGYAISLNGEKVSLFYTIFEQEEAGKVKILSAENVDQAAQVFVDAVRGVPMIVLAFFIYFGIPYLFNTIIGGFNVTLTALQAGSACLALNCGAYMSEIIRAGIQSVDIGQMEAARSLGLPYGKAMRKVVLPQAIRTMIPSIINQFIITLKDTSILSVIGFPELVNTAKNVQANTFMAFQTWAIVGIMYLIVITILSRSAKVVERRLNVGR